MSTGLHRDTIDKYYTKESIVKICVKFVKKYLKLKQNDLVIEPSAGNGSFINEIKLLTNNYKFYDLQPENNEIIQCDFLDLDVTHLSNTHVIGNPPFGRQSSIAIKFIKKCCKFCKTLSFILPKSFKKDSMKNKFPLEFHLVWEYDLPPHAFTVDGQEHDVPCVFQIWERRDYNRAIVEKLQPKHFKFVKRDEEPDISFRRVGVNAGRIDTEVESKSIQSHYFIKFIDCNCVKELYEIEYDSDNTVGPKSISKQELISKFNPILEEKMSINFK